MLFTLTASHLSRMFGTIRGGVQWSGLLQTPEMESIPASIKMSGAGSHADGVM